MAVWCLTGKFSRESSHLRSEAFGLLLIHCERYPPMVYTKDGQEIKERLWEETMEELNFAGASKIVQDMQR